MANRQDQEEIKAIQFPIVGVYNNRASSEGQDQRFVNCFPEYIQDPITESKKYYLVKRAGLESHTSIAVGEARGVYSWNSKIYSVIGDTVYANTSSVATLGTSTGRVSITELNPSASTVYLCISDGQKLYLVNTSDVMSTIDNTQVQTVSITTAGTGATTGTWGTTGGGGSGATGTFTASAGVIISATVTARGTGYTSTPTITATTGSLGTGVLTAGLCAFPPNNIVTITSIDGFVIAGKSTGELYSSDVSDPTIWRSTNYISAEMYPDTLTAIHKQNNLLVALGRTTVEFFYDAANATGSPFSRIEQNVLTLGCVARWSVQTIDRKMLWVGNSGRGGYTVFAVEGATSLEAISTEFIEKLLNAEGTAIADCYGYTIKMQGHSFYVLNLTSRTLVYDMDIKMWHEWENTAGSRFDILSAVEFNNAPYGLHATNGKTYKFSPTVYQDDSTNFTVVSQTSKQNFNTMRRKFMSRLELVGDSQSSSCEISVQYTDDDYRTWSTARTVDMNNNRAMLKRLGSFRNRAFKFSHTANTALRLDFFEVDVCEGTN